MNDEQWCELYIDIATAVNAMSSSYLAPALHLNNYFEASACDVEWDEIKYDLPEDAFRPSGELRRLTADIHASSVLLAVKSALDKLMPILRYYYPGIEPHTTWGRYDKTGKSKGFMATVERFRDKDSLSSLIDAAYNEWIKYAVGPRDALIHYRNAESRWVFLSESTEETLPDGSTERVSSGALVQSHVVFGADDKTHSYGIHSLLNYVEKYYELTDCILAMLATRSPRKPKPKKSPSTQSISEARKDDNLANSA